MASIQPNGGGSLSPMAGRGRPLAVEPTKPANGGSDRVSSLAAEEGLGAGNGAGEGGRGWRRGTEGGEWEHWSSAVVTIRGGARCLISSRVPSRRRPCNVRLGLSLAGVDCGETVGKDCRSGAGQEREAPCSHATAESAAQPTRAERSVAPSLPVIVAASRFGPAPDRSSPFTSTPPSRPVMAAAPTTRCFISRGPLAATSAREASSPARCMTLQFHSESPSFSATVGAALLIGAKSRIGSISQLSSLAARHCSYCVLTLGLPLADVNPSSRPGASPVASPRVMLPSWT
jgi:hypothetical protein